MAHNTLLETKAISLLLFLAFPKLKLVKTFLAVCLILTQFFNINWSFWFQVWAPLITCFLIGGIKANNFTTAFLGHSQLGCGILDWFLISIICCSESKLKIQEPARIAGLIYLIAKVTGFQLGHPGEEAIAFFLLGVCENNFTLKTIFWLSAVCFGNRSTIIGMLFWFLFNEKIKFKYKAIAGILGTTLITTFTLSRINEGFPTFTGRIRVWERATRPGALIINLLGRGIHNPIYLELTKIKTSSLHNVFLDIAYGGGLLGLIAFLWVLWNYKNKILIPLISTLFGWYFCSSNFWLFWLIVKSYHNPLSTKQKKIALKKRRSQANKKQIT